MERSRNGGGNKMVTFEDAINGRHRNGGTLSMYHDIGGGREVDAGRAAPRPLQPHQGAVSRRRTYADGELDVFSAERYFKGAMDGGVHRKEDGLAVVVPPAAPLEMVVAASATRPAVAVANKPVVGTRASAASVSASSAASANSQTMLLRGGRRRRRDHRDKSCCVKVGVLMRSCSGKRSVRVDSSSQLVKEGPGTGGEPAAIKIDWYRELGMHKAALGIVGDGSNNHGVVAATLPPPNLNLGTAKVAAIGIGREVIREDKAAEFTSSSSRRRSFTPAVAPVRADDVPVPANGSGGNNEHEDDDDDGAGSESSSDLFEIKSLMIEDCPYEPSEASIQWSVATASASERGDRVSARWIAGGSHHLGRRDAARDPVAWKQNRDRPVALLSGCVSRRAVEVSAVAATKAVPNAPRRRL